MPLNRHDLARLGPAIAAIAGLLAAAPALAATPGSPNSDACTAGGAPQRSAATCAARPSVGSAVVAPTSGSAPAWLPEWIGPAPTADVADYSAMYGVPSVPTAPGMIVAIDAETGLPIRPSAAQRRALALAMSAESSDLLAPSAAPLLIERLPGGGEIMTLNGHFQMYSIARIGPDGRVVTDCAQDPATAKRMLTTPSTPRVRAEKE
jgi:hypothetical protein